mmetsp:Transcript_61099/g.68411  ORF Transcript_61099/g.68411 Transcript_61099/m.68411 type:complete len:112 (-) Transcript_61099:201-536(-)
MSKEVNLVNEKNSLGRLPVNPPVNILDSSVSVSRLLNKPISDAIDPATIGATVRDITDPSTHRIDSHKHCFGELIHGIVVVKSGTDEGADEGATVGMLPIALRIFSMMNDG